MTVSLLDVNVLLALAWPNHQHHTAAVRWFMQESAQGWATCALTELGFVRLSSNPAFTPAAVHPRDAAVLLRTLTSRPTHHFWNGLGATDPGCFDMALGHQQVNDAWLVALASHQAGRVVTFDGHLSAHAKDPALVLLLSP